MEHIKSSYKRYLKFGIIISTLILFLNYFFTNNLHWTMPIALLVLCFFFSKLIIYQESSAGYNKIFFAHDGLCKIENDKVILKKLWNELDIKEKKPFIVFYRNITLEVHSKNEDYSFKFFVNWFNEESVFELVQKYVPKEHSLYKRIEDYATDNKLEL